MGLRSGGSLPDLQPDELALPRARDSLRRLLAEADLTPTG
jgi:hypothetical protein